MAAVAACPAAGLRETSRFTIWFIAPTVAVTRLRI
jgi:hypothetical protein